MNKLFLTSIITISIIIIIGYYVFNCKDVISHADLPADSSNLFPPQIKIQGITYTQNHLGKKLFFIKAESIEIKKKKLGFFRIGLLKQIELNNVKIDYYKAARNSDSQNTDMDFSSSLLNAGKMIQTRKQRIAGILVHNVHIQYHQIDGAVTKLRANSLEFKKDRKLIKFKGNVMVNFGNRTLLSKELYFKTKEGVIFTKEKYVLINNGKRQQGQGISTDLHLTCQADNMMQ